MNKFFYRTFQVTASVYWAITVLNFNHALENLRTMGDINFTNFLSDRLMGCYPESASYCCFRKTVSNNIFQKVLLINFISTSGSAFHFSSLPADRRL